MDKINEISFRKLEEEDLKLMHTWLNKEFVNKWFGENRLYDEIKKRYLPYIKGEKPTYPFVIVCNKQDIGYIQTYMIKDYPEYSQYVNSNKDAAGMDLFIGEKEYIHKGLGVYIMTKFLRNYVFVLNDTDWCIIGPEPKNKAAIRAYEKTGFRYIKTIQIPDEKEPEYLMGLNKKNLKDMDVT